MAKQSGSFDTDRPIYKIPHTIYRVVLTGALWLVCSLPVFTAGAACCAALAEFTDRANDGPHKLTAGFFQSFRRCFRRATVIWCGALAALALLALDLAFYQQLPIGSTAARRVVLTLLCILADLVVGISRFAFHALAVGEDGRWQDTLRRAAGRTLAFLPVWACMLLMDLALFVFFISTPYFLFLLPLLPGVLALVHSRLLACTHRPDTGA
ncbi:MAG: DUF624 domain-containing protein [Eubacteriales bacterium]|nr:DUF624 domain-containing protein [Eubacteriales bacterium]